MLLCSKTKMATAGAAGAMDFLSDVDYMVMRARQYSKSDPHSSKAWLITAKSLFPSSFVIQVRILHVLFSLNMYSYLVNYYNNLR